MRRFLRPLMTWSVLVTLASSAVAQGSQPGTFESMQGFGSVIALGEHELVIGEPGNLFRPGMVYLYSQNEAGEWQESAQLTAAQPALQDRFGSAIAIHGNTLLVSADSRREETPGVVYQFTRNEAGGWEQTGQWSPGDAMAGDRFGASLVLGSDFALIGAPSQADTAGAVYVFAIEDDGLHWSGKLVPDSANAGDRFGASMSVDGDHLLIGAPGRNSGRGTVFHFHRVGGEWVEQSALDPGRVDERSGFGTTVAVNGSRAYVGMPRFNNRVGAVAVFTLDQDTGEWQPANRLVPFDAGRRAGFGSALAVTDDGLLVGAPGSASIHAFSGDEDGWSGVVKILPEYPLNSRSYGGAIAAGAGLIAVGVSGADGGAGTAVVLRNDGEGWMSSTTLMSDSEGLEAITGGQVDCQEGFAASYDCTQVDLVSFLPVSAISSGRGGRLNDVWGWTDPETGREYALIGRLDGTSFVDMTNALYPRYLGDLPKTSTSPASVWRDIKVYRNHAYIVADGAGDHGMQVFDLTQLRDVTEPVVFEETFHYTGIASAHNVVINEGTGFAYAVGSSSGGTTCGGGLHMIDVRDPAQPVFAGCFSDNETGRRGTGYSHDAQCVVYTGPDPDYQGREICIGANENAISFADVTDKDNPVSISIVSYPNVAYAHQGWLTEDMRYFYSNDEGDEPNGSVSNTRTLVWDVADLDDPILVNEYFALTTETDHNLYVRGDFMYQSNYGAGFRVLDISDPENPVEVGYFDTAPEELGCCGTWSNYPYFESGVIPVTGGNAGVFFVRKHEAPVP